MISHQKFAELFLNKLPRSKIEASMLTAIKNSDHEMNTGYFLNPAGYQPYFTYLGESLDINSENHELSLVSIEILRWLWEVNDKSRHRLLDFACGIPTLLLCANEMGIDSRGFDRWKQIPESVAVDFLEIVKRGKNSGWPLENEPPLASSLLNSIDEVKSYSPTIISVASYWIEDLELYELPNLEYVLSDALYNSGRVKGNGIYHYLPNWNATPEDLGLQRVESFQYLDVYKVVRD